MHRLQDGKSEQRCHKDADDLAHIRAQQELDRLADVIIDPAAFLHGSYDGGEVIIRKHHIRHIFGHVRARNAHAYTDVRAFDAGRVIDAVAGHSRDNPALAPGVDNARLMLGLDAGINRNIPEFLFKFLVAHPVQRRAGDRARLIGQDAELTGNRHRGIDMVAGNHDRADAGLAAFLDCSLDLGTNRVDHTGKADKNEFLFQLRRAAVRGYRIPEAEAGRQHAQRPVGHGLVRREDFSALCLGHGFDLTVFPDTRCRA